MVVRYPILHEQSVSLCQFEVNQSCTVGIPVS